MTGTDPDEFVPCPRHGTRCYPEFRDDLARRVECAIGLGDCGPSGVKATANRILMMIEDHALAEVARTRDQIATEIESTPHPCHESDDTYCPCADLQCKQDIRIARSAVG